MTVTERPRQVGNLPVPLTSFLGRRQEVAKARDLLATNRMLTLTGTGGVGKTRLALRAAMSVQRAFPGGVWFVGLAELTDPTMLPHTIAGALGVRDESSTPLARLTGHLANEQALIVLDNCEHLPDACAVLLGELLPRAPKIKIIATSRHRLGVEGEQLMHVDPFPVPSTWCGGDGMEAVRLFVERARAVAPTFGLTEDNRDTVLAICGRLDGLPLAIELAAVWVATLTPVQILSKVSDRFNLLTEGSRTARPHQRTLQATIDWSFSLCSAQEQALWARLSVFTGGFDLNGAEAVGTGPEVGAEDVVPLLARLVDKSILRRDHADGTVARYQMLETVRSYGLARLTETGQDQVVRTRHRDYFRELSVRYEAECFGPRQVEWLLQLRHEHANLRAAIEFCLAAGDGRTALEVAGPTYHWISSGHLHEGRTWLDRALTLDRSPSAARAKALWVRGFLAILLGETDAPERALAECRTLAEQLDRTDVFYPKVWQCEGLVAFRRHDLDAAKELFEQALAGHLEAGHGHLHCAFDCMFQLALIALHRDEPDAGELVRRCFDFTEQHRALWSRSYAMWLRAVHLWRSGDPDGAVPLLRESVELCRQVNDRTGLAFCLEALAWCAAAKRRWRRAATLLGATSSVCKHSGTNTSYDPMHRFAHRDVIRQVREALDAEVFAKSYARGADATPEEAVALAIDQRPPSRDAGHAPGKQRTSPLTRRETEIAKLVAEGRTNREIATALVISQRTAECHVENILSKLSFSSRIQIATWFAEHHTPPDL